MKVKALLFDTRSIQRYIYSSNRLRANIGASYLVDRVFEDVLLDVLQPLGVDKDTWREKTDETTNWTEMNTKCRIAYIGGGNALVLFGKDVPMEEIEGVVTEFTKRLLQSHPGLRTGAAIGEIGLDPDGGYLGEDGNRLTKNEIEDGKDDLTKLVKKLKQYQNGVFPEVNVPYTGLTQLCPELGEVATDWDAEKKRFCSREFKIKLNAWHDAEKVMVKKIQEVLPEEKKTIFNSFVFPWEIEKLGQRETENYIAIVHIDGNNMGIKFAGQATLTDRKNLSLRLSEKTKKAFASMLCDAVDEYDGYKGFLDLGKDKDGRKILPVRPLVLGGDDMTFICTAKLALRYTKRVMEAMLKAVGDEESVDTCAGIAIQPANYPFFRGYMLAEQACDAAKKEMRALRDKGTEQNCWLEFVIRHGEQAPDLSQIREQEYKAPAGDMHFGPYRVDAPERNGRDISSLIAGLNDLKGSNKQEKGDQEKQERLSMNKIKELRDVIPRNADERGKFLRRLREGKGSLPNVPAWKDYKETLWKDGRTPYIDLIEMMDYYEPEGGKVHGEK